jgi:hypothetical protein
VNNSGGKAIYEEDGCEESFVPKLQWHRSMGEERQTDFDNMAMFAFGTTILLMGVWTGNLMSNADAF